MDFKTVPFDLKSTASDGSTFAGYANCFNNIDAAQEIVAPGAFAERLTEWMSEGNTDVIFLGGINHQWNSPIGKVTSAKEDTKGLFVECQVSQTQSGKDCMVLLKDGVLKKMSIGYRVLGSEYLEDAEDVATYWKEVGYTPSAKDIAAAQYGARLLTKVFLYEASPVVAPANDMADITRVKKYNTDELISYSDMEKRLRDVGLSQKAAKIWVSGFKALYQRDVEEATSTTERADAEEPPKAEPDAEDREPEPKITAEPEAVTQEPATSTAPVVIDLASAVLSSQVSAHYANFLALRAKYGLDGDPKHHGNSTRTVSKT